MSEIEDAPVTQEVVLNVQGKVIKPAKKRSKTTKKKEEFYVNPDELRAEIKKYYDTDNFSDTLGLMIKKIACGMSYCPNFINYTYKDEMISDAIYKMSRAIVRHCYKVESSFSPFAYLSMCSWTAFINRISKEKKVQQIHEDYKDRIYSDLLLEQCEGMDNIHLRQFQARLSDEDVDD